MNGVIASFMIDQCTLIKLDDAAAEEGLDRSKVLRRLVDGYLKKVEEEDPGYIVEIPAPEAS